jgi:hypothetical protein
VAWKTDLIGFLGLAGLMFLHSPVMAAGVSLAHKAVASDHDTLLSFQTRDLTASENEDHKTVVVPDRTSLFDQLFLDSGENFYRYDIPFPFSELMSRIDESLGMSINGDANRVRSVLIPLGRCINRFAASPQFFEFPRVVMGVDSEHHGTRDQQFKLLKDRIFIGYQEMANTMEVISYNPDAGRFEFQVVTDYRENQAPEVEYVERSKCTGCHQNNGPIFSQPPWDETNNNREVFRKLTEVMIESNLEIPVFQGSDASRLDGSSNRANLFALYQEFWQGVCQAGSAPEATRCRAAVFEMVLRHRLQENSRSLAYSNRINRYLYPASINGITRQWPQGISILSSDIYNENPIQNGSRLHLASAEKLLYPRSMMIKWQPENLFRMIEGLGRFISLSDVRHLDSLLYGLATQQRSSQISMNGNCALKRVIYQSSQDGDDWGTGTLSVNCELKQGVFSRPYHFMGELNFDSGVLKTFPVADRLVLDSPGAFIGLTHQGGSIDLKRDYWTVKFDLFDSKQQFHARLPDGSILKNIEIRWPKEISLVQLFAENSLVGGTAILSVLSDHDVLDAALTAMVSNAESENSDLLSTKPFRGDQLMEELFQVLE